MQLQLNLSHGSTKSMRNFCGINPGKDPSKFRILVACEESQAVTIQLRKLGFDAWSCELLNDFAGEFDPEYWSADTILTEQ